MNDLKIIDVLGKTEVLAQLAEEAAEVAQAALKLRRVLDGKNPTPVTECDALDNLVEELADVALCAGVFFGEEGWSKNSWDYFDAVCDEMADIVRRKYDRWGQRLQEAETYRILNET